MVSIRRAGRPGASRGPIKVVPIPSGVGDRGRDLVLVRAGWSWRQLPADFPPWQTVYWYFNQWEHAKVTEKILPVVRTQLRVQAGPRRARR